MDSARVGSYTLERPLGTGGMAETFVALRRGPGGFEQRVCLKRILPGKAIDPRFVELFMDEARLLARLRHTSIVQVYDFGESDGSYYMALELVDGVDLDRLLRDLASRGAVVPWPLAVFVAAQLLSALQFASSVEVDGEPLALVHRDISPSNVLLSLQGEVKLSDFGIAKAHGRSHKTATGFTKGKAAYMSPEQVRGDALDARSDLFALGVVLYEMLTGQHPFEASTDLALLNNILGGAFRPVCELAPDVPLQLDHFVRRLLAPAASARFATPAEALGALSLPDQPYALAAELGRLVREARSREPARSLAPTPARDGSTVPLREDSSSAERPTQPNGTHDQLAARPRSRLPLMVGVAGVALGAALAVWLGRPDPTPPPVPPPPSTAPAQPAPHPAPLPEPARELTPRFGAADALAPTPREQEDAGAATASPAAPDHADAELPATPKRVKRARSEASPSDPAASARKAARARSGANVSTDDF